jgi:hypothetical protein
MPLRTHQILPHGWLAFELSVLHRLKFSAVAFPFTGEPDLGVSLQRQDVRVAANDPSIWSYTKAHAFIENSSEPLDEEDFALILDDAYIPRDKMDNSALENWFNETDAWWFDTVRFNAETLGSPYKRALALTVGMMVGDYVLSFPEELRQLREPLSLSRMFRRFAETLPERRENSARSKATNQDVRTFIAERRKSDLMFLRLPAPVVQPPRDSVLRWREEWLEGNDSFWGEIEQKRAGQLGARVQSKQQYLGFVEDLLHTAAHIPAWAIAHTENGFISTDELVETIGRVRKVREVYSKDFSDLLGVRAAIVTAN